MTKKIIAILMAMALVLSFAACGAKNDETTEPAQTVADTTAAPEETSAPVEETSIEETSAEAVSEEATSAEETTQAAAKVPETTEEIIEFYNKAANAAKADSKSITYNYMKHAPAGNVSGLPKMFNSLADTVISNNTGADKSKTNLALNTQSLKNTNFPVENESWASKLTADDVKSATCTESNGVYTIKIVTKSDDFLANVKHGSYHNPKAFNVVLPSTVADNIPSAVAKVFSIGTVAIAFPSSTITVKVDAATGNIKTANYLMYWTMKIPLGNSDVIIPFSTESDYTVNF